MTGTHLFKNLLSLVLLLTITASSLKATEGESYIQSLSGKIKKGDSCTVIDDKFLNLPLEQWNLVRNLSVENLITFELRQDTSIYYHNKPFTCTLSLSIRYFTSRDQLKPEEINNIRLTVKYDTAKGKFYPVFDRYTFKNAFRVIVIIDSIQSQEWGDKLPAIFRISNQIMVKRKYPFSPEVNAKLGMSISDNMQQSSVYRVSPGTPVDNHLTISWDANDFTNFSNGFGTPEEYDLEWTFIDKLSERAIPFTNATVTPGMVEELMRFDNSRVTISTTSYKINLAFPAGYIVTRVRGAWNDDVSGVRQTTNWQYLNSSNQVAFTAINFHEENLNWQYVASYAEEGKRKDIISYFDGSTRNRQSVTINNSENVAVVGETIYDNMGRPAMSILPSPINNNILKYYPAENKNGAGEPYSHTDISAVTGANVCTITAGGLNISAGAARYYSPNNGFIGDPEYYFTKYVSSSVAPDQHGYPFSLTEYMPDNTGRVRRQGGVGYDFRIGSGHETTYFYGKPLQSELDRLFGMEAGIASHYLKNVVVDPNGQLSVSYLDASGRTVATALAGVAPDNTDALPSALEPQSKKTKTDILMRPADFQSNSSTLSKQASATFVIAVKNVPVTIFYSASPASFGPWNGPIAGQQFCSNCYYDIEVTVKDDCGSVVATAATPAFTQDLMVCNSNTAPFEGSVNFIPVKYGEYTVTYRLRLNEDVIKNQTDYYIGNNIELKKLQKFFEEELTENNILGCYSDCEACKKTGDLPSFTQKVKDMLIKIRDEKYPADQFNFDINSTYINTWITEQFNAIVSNCQLIAANCVPSPCEQKLEMMKYDVRPGGQYAMYTYNESTGQYSITDDGTNVLMKYDDGIAEINNLTYEDANGNIVHIRENGQYISQSTLIAEYIKHPEWADAFVKLHIEYCSYLWCKDASNPVPAFNNEVSYRFDENLREVIIKGQDAVNKGYYSHTDYLLLSNIDPFFNGGRGTSYKSRLQSDLENLSAVLRMTFKDLNGNFMPVKNIKQLVEWALYCKPVNENATATDFLNSWNSCVPDINCRSLTGEWELFKNYYLKIKSKYVRLAKLAYDPACENCFIGQDALMAGICEEPGPLSDYAIVGGIVSKKLFYRPGGQGAENKPFKSNYRVKIRYVDGPSFYVNAVKGAMFVDLSNPGLPGDPILELVAVECKNGIPQSVCSGDNGGGQGPAGPCPDQSEFAYETDNFSSSYTPGCPIYSSSNNDIYFVHTAGPVTRPVNIKIIEQRYSGVNGTELFYRWETLLPGQSRLYLGQERSDWSDVDCNGSQDLGEISTANYYVDMGSITCPPSGFQCPSNSDFSVNYNSPCITGNTPGTNKLTITYTGTSALPFPANKKITVTCSVSGSSGNFTVPVIINNYSGKGSTCIGGAGISIFSAIVTGVVCEDVVALPSSTCSNDPRASLYASRMRIFDEYVDEQRYLDCNASNDEPVTQAEADAMSAAAIAAMRDQAIETLDALKQNWIETLKGARDEEFPALTTTSLTDAVINNLVNNLYLVARKYIEIAPKDNIRPASTLPVGGDPGYSLTIFADNDYNNFNEVFMDYIGNSLMQQGFGPHLLDQPYPYNKTPITGVPNGIALSPATCSTLNALRGRWTNAGSPGTFHTYLKTELKEDFILTAVELAELEARCGNNCKLLNDPLSLPAVFATPNPSNPDHPWLDCNRITALYNNFAAAYPNVATGTKLYRNLLPNFINTSLGYALSYYDYDEFKNLTCATVPGAVLYNKPTSPVISYENDIVCIDNILRNVFDKAGQEYELYIENERRKFRNGYISKCLSNKASAKLHGEQYEYHYTLYYYDQSGNLVKTIPPAGVALLSDEEVDLVENFRNADPASCTGIGFPNSVDATATFNALSTALQNGSAHSAEMWLQTETPGSTRQVRIITPDHNYLYQAAIHNDKLWIEIYTLQQTGAGQVNVIRSNSAVADISALPPLQPWSHLQIQSTGSLAAGTLQLYLDGRKLTNMTGTLPPYPLGWNISSTAAAELPQPDLAQLKHFRIYDRTATDAEILANYKNVCLGPEGTLAVQSSPLLHWGRFNFQPYTYCQPGQADALRLIDNRGSLRIIGPGPGITSPSITPVSGINNNFTVEMWVNPQYPHQVDVQSQSGVSGTSGQKYAIYPVNGEAWGGATMGISVGTNGVSVYEHANSYMPALLVWSGTLSGWNHIAVVYWNKIPALYINGQFVKSGLQSTKTWVYPSYYFGGSDDLYGAFTGGYIDEVRIWSVSKSQEAISANYAKSLYPGSTIDVMTLAGYWPMNADEGANIKNTTCAGGWVGIGPGAQWATTASPVKDLAKIEYTSRFIVPDHALPTTYAYNSLNQVVKQTSPDGGTSEFWYDRLGRLAVSQNQEQKTPFIVDDQNPSNRFSYTRYDALGRIIEVGEKIGSGSAITESVVRDDLSLQNWYGSGTNRQVTATVYDEQPSWVSASLAGMQKNLRKRVAVSAILGDAVPSMNYPYLSDPSQNRIAASYYNYDVLGNVATLVQENTNMAQAEPAGGGLKKIQYDYDLVSGKVNKVLYQDGKWDQFYYQYIYDADNRLVKALSSRNNYVDVNLWIKEASYRYYLHGPLARMELGNNKVQGVDYAYTLQGWLKYINSPILLAEADMNKDGDVFTGNPMQFHGRDVFALGLQYFTNDYKPVAAGSTARSFSNYNLDWPANTEAGHDLFNGNVSKSMLAVSGLIHLPGGPNSTPYNQIGYAYRYDQLNRLVKMRRTLSSLIETDISLRNYGLYFDSYGERYKENISYDANGNILTSLRNGAEMNWDINSNPVSLPREMDNLTYGYKYDNGRLLNNRLRHVNDNPAYTNNYTEDIDNQDEDNYKYDNIGNLKSDNAESLTNINWTAYGKIASVLKPGDREIHYSYDAGGNRVTKLVNRGGTAGSLATYYVRDAQGNVLGVYTYDQPEGSPIYQWKEQHLYGSSRIGIVNTDITYTGTDTYNAGNDNIGNGIAGRRVYELTNHLGNVLATISDVKTGVDIGSNGTTDYYAATVLTANDYYPFGMLMPGRKYSVGDSYRYGFNGKENDDDVKGIEGSQQDYGMRIYDPRLGRFLSRDPLYKDYPELTPYQFASNTPIRAVDLDGGEMKDALDFGWGPEYSRREDIKARLAKRDGHEWILLPAAIVTGAGVGSLITVPTVVTSTVTFLGKAYILYEVVSSFEHNKSSTPEGRAEQDKRGKEHLANAFVAWGLGKMIEVPAKYMTGRFIIGRKTLKTVTEHLKQFGEHAENKIMLERMEKIVRGELKATEIDINFAKHELREAEMMKNGLSYREAHDAVLKEQGMYHKKYAEKLYTAEALKAGDEQFIKEVTNK